MRFRKAYGPKPAPDGPDGANTLRNRMDIAVAGMPRSKNHASTQTIFALPQKMT
jgi:hypothetical protein